MKTKVNVQTNNNKVKFKAVGIGDWFRSPRGELCVCVTGINPVYGGDFNAISVLNADQYFFDSDEMVTLITDVTITTKE